MQAGLGLLRLSPRAFWAATAALTGRRPRVLRCSCRRTTEARGAGRADAPLSRPPWRDADEVRRWSRTRL
ncbi:hypothetical protein VQ042_10360 [Aurantimonas sp. A2-1-M11]|uniref:hypothetical protein n=1 Tax=Aurantimonas sp. A2-1-M11 TaxID=3113712 RepID=UPI002F943598